VGVNPGQIAACNPTWPGAPSAEQKQAVFQGPYAGLDDPITCARGARACMPPKEGASSRARAKSLIKAREPESQEPKSKPLHRTPEPKTLGSESRKRHPIYAIDALLGDVLECRFGLSACLFLVFHGKSSRILRTAALAAFRT
jgi:hypothetical protein